MVLMWLASGVHVQQQVLLSRTWMDTNTIGRCTVRPTKNSSCQCQHMCNFMALAVCTPVAAHGTTTEPAQRLKLVCS
jgi:hypothetical protein